MIQNKSVKLYYFRDRLKMKQESNINQTKKQFKNRLEQLFKKMKLNNNQGHNFIKTIFKFQLYEIKANQCLKMIFRAIKQTGNKV